MVNMATGESFFPAFIRVYSLNRITKPATGLGTHCHKQSSDPVSSGRKLQLPFPPKRGCDGFPRAKEPNGSSHRPSFPSLRSGLVSGKLQSPVDAMLSWRHHGKEANKVQCSSSLPPESSDQLLSSTFL